MCSGSETTIDRSIECWRAKWCRAGGTVWSYAAFLLPAPWGLVSRKKHSHL